MDPTCEEEDLSSGPLTIAYNNHGSLCSVFKPGGTLISIPQLKECFELAFNRVKEVNLK